MHTGFTALRNAMPMDSKASGAPLPVDAATRADVARMRALLADCRARFGAQPSNGGGPWLFGAFSLADCYFAPIVVRFRGYGVPLDGAVAAWTEAMWALPALAEWVAAGRAESETVPVDVLELP
jgi:glutathione S-transferase